MKITRIRKERKVRQRANARIYFWPTDWLVEEHALKLKHYRELLPEVFDRLNLTGNVKVHWSRTAGCACGCSPGFIVETPSLPDDIHVHVGSSA